MRNILFILFSLALSTQVSAHQFFFAYAEVEYNEITQKFEGTIDATGHDIENAIGISKKVGLENIVKGSKSFSKIEAYINEHLKISGSETNIMFDLVGIEIDLDDKVHLYIESNPVELNPSIEITFDILMEEFDEQQNKLTLIWRDRSTTYTFLPHQRTQIVELSI